MQSVASDPIGENQQSIKIVTFNIHHIEVAALRGHDLEEFHKNGEVLAQHPSITLVGKEGIILFLGIVIKENTGYVWLIPTDKFNKRAFESVKVIKKCEEAIVDAFGLKKLVTNGHDDPTVKRWLGWLGFVHKQDMIYIKEL